MNKLSILPVTIVALVLTVSCNEVRRSPGHVYMPDMAYSRAYETYASHENLKDINYTSMPVPGTIKRGELLPFPLAKDAPGDSTNYVASRKIPNPLPPLDTTEMLEARRLYLINCGICHGSKLDGNGPLYKDGSGPYPAKPATLVGDAKYESMPDGEMFYSVTYGKNMMGPYASQLSTTQRWQIIHYIKAEQAKGKKGAEPEKDSTAASAQ